ncbi:MAG: hypothetical protein E5W00_08190 [Mesorhizobium sp.]|nr:MAG: hypothetical protein E5W00_08190 [Mesorhizobium sp.]TIX30382.1 MAG: hypothetical protein E5V34_09310 [Mesorhizobium sp.]
MADARGHIHTVVRTPNGNDYGKDLLRQHHEAHAHDPGPRPPPTLRNKSCSTSYAKAQRNMNFRVGTLEREEIPIDYSGVNVSRPLDLAPSHVPPTASVARLTRTAMLLDEVRQEG